MASKCFVNWLICILMTLWIDGQCYAQMWWTSNAHSKLVWIRRRECEIHLTSLCEIGMLRCVKPPLLNGQQTSRHFAPIIPLAANLLNVQERLARIPAMRSSHSAPSPWGRGDACAPSGWRSHSQSLTLTAPQRKALRAQGETHTVLWKCVQKKLPEVVRVRKWWHLKSFVWKSLAF